MATMGDVFKAALIIFCLLTSALGQDMGDGTGDDADDGLFETLREDLSLDTFSLKETSVPYEIVLEGVTDKAAARLIRKKSTLYRWQKKFKGSFLALHHRAQSDEKRIYNILASFGYFDAKVDTHVDREKSLVTIKVEQGPAYSLGSHIISYDPRYQKPPPIPLDKIGLTLDTPVNVKAIVTSKRKIIIFLKDHGYPYAVPHERIDFKDESSKTIQIIEKIHQGPRSYFGKIRIEGLEDVPQTYVTNRLRIKKGDLFDRATLEKNKADLIQTGQFDLVAFDYPQTAPESAHVPVTLKVHHRKPRTIQGGIRFSTDEKWGVKGGWEHRNITGRADRLGLDVIYGKYQKNALLGYQLPDFYGAGNTARVQLHGMHEKNYLYKTENISPELGISREFSNQLTGDIGLNYERGKTRREGKRLRYSLVGIPLALRLDRSDDLLEPKRGFRTHASFFPQWGKVGPKKSMATSQLKQTFYAPFGKQDKVVAAFWGKIALIHGIKRDDTPANKRLYAGGLGSIRAYKYLFATPLDARGKPLGGRSSYQVGAETRIKIAPRATISPFYEGGYVSNRHFPNSKDKFLSGVGIGFTYSFPIAPLHVDIAFPLKHRKSASGRRRDDFVKFYFGIGQAF